MKYSLHNYSESELAYKEFLRPSIQQAIELLNIGENSQILDAGCGPGSMFTYFAQKIKSPGHITGIDASVPHLEIAGQIIEKNKLERIVSLKQVDLFKDLPFLQNHFDVIWLSDVLFPDDFGNEIFNTLKRLYRILKPGGKIAVFYGNWLRLNLLPGYSVLEHSISIANEKRKSVDFTWKPEVHPENCLEWLHECGFITCENHFLNSTYQFPLMDHIKNYIHYHLTHIYQKAILFKSEDFQLKKEQCDEFYQITDISSAEYILSKPFYHCAVHALFTLGQKAYNQGQE